MPRASAAAEAQAVGRHFEGTASHSRTRLMVMHSNVKVCWGGLLKPIACGEASERQCVPGHLRQADLVVPVHRSIEQPPNQRLQLTPLAASEIVAFLKLSLGSTVISIYHCGATEAQAVGLPLCKLLLCRSSHGNVIAPCPIVCQSSSGTSFSFWRHRILPSRAKRHRSCPPCLSVIAPCPLARETSPHMPISHHRYRAMLCSRAKRRHTCPSRTTVIVPCSARVRKVVAHAHPIGTSSRHAHSRAGRSLEQCGQPNKRLQRTALRAEQDRGFLESSLRPDCLLALECAAAEAQDVGRHTIFARLICMPLMHHIIYITRWISINSRHRGAQA